MLAQVLQSQRYDLRRVLGRGATGTVFEAFDRQLQETVALKLLDARAGELLYRLKREFRLLAEVQHEHLVRLGELTYEGGRWFFTMQLVQGVPFTAYVRPDARGARGRTPSRPSHLTEHRSPSLRPSRPSLTLGDELPWGPGLDGQRLRSALGQVVAALSALHAAGYVHRDVKPSNVLVTEDGQVVLLDFGISELIRQAATAAAPSGTPGYMAPEVVEGGVAGPAADFYALGAMLYLALTGKLPFQGSDHEVMEAKVLRSSPSPGFLAPDAPADLLALCQDLLQRAPERRPGAKETLARLGVGTPGGGELAVASVSPAPFVGRALELEALDRALADVRSGRGRNLVLQGESGIGKSALMGQFVETLGPDALVLSARCYEQENVPLKGIDGLVDALSEQLCALSDSEVRGLIGGGVRYLSALFPVLTRVDAIHERVQQAGEVSDEGALRELAAGELERILDALARRALLVITVDDLQWADGEGLAMLTRILLRSAPRPALFLATLRPLAEPPTELLRLLAESERIDLGGLSDRESASLWRALRPGDGRASDASATWSDASGHPMLLAELARAASALDRALCAPMQLHEVLWERVASREPVERRFLEMLALAGTPTPYEVVARAADLSVGDCLTRLTGLKNAQLVRLSRVGDERVVEMYHDRLREAVVAHLDRPEERDRVLPMQRRLGWALDDATPSERHSHRVYAAVQHLATARSQLDASERPRLARLYLRACRMARLETAFERAREYACEGLSLARADRSGADVERLVRHLSVEELELSHLTGRTDEARAAFERVRSQGSLAERVTLHVSWIGLETSRARFVEAVSVGREILRELDESMPSRATLGHVFAQLAEFRVRLGRRSLGDLANLPTMRSDRHALTLDVLVALAPATFIMDDMMLHSWIRLRVTNLSLQHGVSRVSSAGFAGLAFLLAGAFQRYDDALTCGRLALALNERFDNRDLAPELAYVTSFFILPWARSYAECSAALEQASAIASRYGNPAMEAYTSLARAIMAVHRGASLPEVARLATQACEVAEQRGMTDTVGVATAALEYAAHLRGLPGPAAATPGSAGLEPMVRAQYRAEVAYFAGDIEAAQRHVNAARAHMRPGSPTNPDLFLLCALVAARRWDEAAPTARPQLLWTVVENTRRLRALARVNPANYGAHYPLARAELLRLVGAPARAHASFMTAAGNAERHDSLRHQALAYELAGRLAGAQDRHVEARALRGRAREVYARWASVPAGVGMRVDGARGEGAVE